MGQTYDCQEVAHSVRSDGSHSGSDKTCQVTYETNPNVCSLPLEQVTSRAGLPVGGQPCSPRYIQWWTDQRHLLSGLPLCPPEAQTVITTDASSLGWGGVLGKETPGGGGGEQYDGTRHMATNGAGMAHQQTRTGSSSADTEALPSPSNRSEGAGPVGQHHHMRVHQQVGGTRSHQLCWQAWDLGNWCIQNDVQLHAIHVPGVDNVLADFLSRQAIDQREWELHQHVANMLFKIWEKTQHRSVCVSAQPQTDNVLLPVPVPCSDLQGRVLLELEKLLQRVCVPTNGAHTESASEGPAGPSTAHPHSTFVAQEALVPGATESADSSASGTSSETGSVSSVQSATPRPVGLGLVAWRISGVTSEHEAFLRTLLAPCSPRELSLPQQHTMLSGESLNVGAVDNIWIPMLQL